MAGEMRNTLFDIVHELQQKKEELAQLEQRSHTEYLIKQELLAENEGLKAQVGNLQAQLELTNKVLHKAEEGTKEARDSSVKAKLGLEVPLRLNDKMKDEYIRLHSENMALKKQVEQLEKEMKSEVFNRESCMSKQTKVQATIESLMNHIRGLEKEFKDLEEKCKSALSHLNKSKLLLENKDNTIKQLQEKLENLSSEKISLNSQMQVLKLNENRNKPVEQVHVKEILKEWHNSLNVMKDRTQSHERESETLHQTLETALKNIKKFKELEELANRRLRELEEERRENRMCTDCSVQTDLIMSIEVGCQTNGIGVDTSSPQAVC